MLNNPIKGNLKAIQDHVIVCDMDFGDHTTESGIIIKSDDGITRGVRPRWARVYKKGPKNNDEYKVGDWVLVEHGRWTRGFKYLDNDEEIELRMVDIDSILMYTNSKPDTFMLGEEYTNGDEFSPDKFSNLGNLY